MRSDDTGAWFERRLAEPSFVIPEIADFRRQRGTAREREGAFGNAAITAEVRYFLVTKHYPSPHEHVVGRREPPQERSGVSRTSSRRGQFGSEKRREGRHRAYSLLAFCNFIRSSVSRVSPP